MDVTARFRLICAAALTDGELHPAELRVLRGLATDWGLTAEDAGAILRDVAQGGDVPVHPPEAAEERIALFRAIVDVVVADRQLKVTEFELLRRVSGAFGLPRQGVNLLLKEAVADQAASDQAAAGETPADADA